MNISKFLLPAAGAVAFIGAAHAEPVGTVASVEGDVLAMRGNEVLTLAAGDAVHLNDRIVTRADSAATVAANGCATELGATSTLVVDDALCAGTEVSHGYAQGGGEVTVGSLLIAGTMLAVPLIVGLAVEDDDDDVNEIPVSP